ncbi:ABC transporter ATP-binding protein [Archaeoglobales archaeon ex4484_92]|nr:MAG: ABC transporter ATP-binding protein [Archaeoglobales archaeon ex4484_92]
MIEFREVSFSYNSILVLEDLSFKIEEREFVAVLGPNGAGKSTLLKLMLGLLKPKSGRIKVFGYDPRINKDKILRMTGYLPQRENLSYDIPLTVYQVVTMPLRATGRKVEKEKVLELLSIVGMEDKTEMLFNELSGGQQQRVMIARALLHEPKLLLLDEPFSGVDVPSQEKIIEVLESLAKKGVTIVAVVHNINPLLHHISKIMLLNRKLIAYGKPNDVLIDDYISETYGRSIPLVVCEEGFTHPLYGDFRV